MNGPADLYGIADPVADLDGLTRDEWLQLRREGIGGSDAAPILGMSPWSTSLDVWLDKTGQTEPWDGNERTKWGQRLEDAVAAGLAEDAGLTLYRPGHMLAHPDHPWLMANPDRLAYDPNRGPGVVEIKTGDARTADHWTGDRSEGDVPDWYALQVQHYLAATGHTWGVIGVLLGGNDLRWRHIDRDDDVIAIMVDAYAEFWQHVTDRTPPPVTGAPDAAKKALGRYYTPADPDAQVDLPDELVEALREAVALDTEAKALADEAETRRNLVRSALGAATEGLHDGVPVVTWREQNKTDLDRRAVACALGITEADLKANYSTTSRVRVLRPKKKALTA